MRRLGTDPALRSTLGANAKAYWAGEHTPELMGADYVGVIEHALASPLPAPTGLPPHLRRDGTELTRSILNEMGVGTDVFQE